MKSSKKKRALLRAGSYVLTAVLSFALVFALYNKPLSGRSAKQPGTGEAFKRSVATQKETDASDESSESTDNAEKQDNAEDHSGQKIKLDLRADASDLQRAAVKAIPSVVLIKTYNPQADFDYFAFFMGRSEGKRQVEKKDDVYSQNNLIGEGSGVIYTSDGYIITNQHVLADGTAWQVVTSDGVVYNAEKVGEDEITDLAVLKIDAEGLPAADIGSSSSLTIADQVIAIGNPAGEELSSTVTVGYVSALNRVINAANGSSMGYIQTDTAINPGNSGGALVNMRGQVVGINSSKLNAARYEGLGFAIPMDTAIPLVKDMIKYGEVQGRVTLGVIGQYVQSQYLDEDGRRICGFLIARVQNPALTEAGIKPDQIIIQIDDLEVNSARALRSYLAGKKDGDKVTLKLLDPETGKTLSADVELHASYDK